MATITKRDDNVSTRRWQARVRRKGFPVQTKAFASRAEAEAWGRALEALYDLGHAVDTRDAREITVRDVLARYLADVVPGLKGHETETYRCKVWMRHPLAEYAMANLTRQALTDYRDTRLLTVTGSTVRHEMLLLARAIEYGRKELGIYLAENPLRSVRLPKENAARERRLLPGEEERLLAACRGSGAPYLEHLVVVAVETGMRQSEILGLRWDRISFEKRVAVLGDTKNGEARAVPLTHRAAAAMQAMRTVRELNWHRKREYTDTGPFSKLNSTVVRHSFMRTRDRAGMPDLRFHDLRHEATSRLFEKGLNTMEVSAITGHKTLTMLRRYAHLSMDHLLMKLG
ncbi:integrase [Caballeronia udeis]|uniref:Integrase n=1 Tax=Caballeronia udeis TaxID=1232866 RepID=A0ABW8MAN3_9BURK